MKIERITANRREAIADEILDGLVLVEKAYSLKVAPTEPPILLGAEMDPESEFAVYEEMPQHFDVAALQLGTSGEAGGAQLKWIRTTRSIFGGVEGQADVLFFRSRRAHRFTLAFRWTGRGRIEVRFPRGHWTTENGEMAGIFNVLIGLLRRRETEPRLFLAIGDLAVETPCSLGFARRLLSSRDVSPGASRRDSMRHFVDNYFRSEETKDGDEVWVRKHLRGSVECGWYGYRILMRPPESWVEENEGWIEARDAYRHLSAEEKARARDVIRSTYGIKPEEALA